MGSLPYDDEMEENIKDLTDELQAKQTAMT
jgi:hypothetical protein